MLLSRLLPVLCFILGFSPPSQCSARPVVPGAERLARYLPQLQGKKVALVVNHTSRVGESHLVDVLLQEGIAVQKVFAPEHGFRGDLGAHAPVADAVDIATGLPIVSLYGSVKKPTQAMLADVEVVVFDIQDVGVRCYTYLSTLHYVMEACAAFQCPLMVLDRPNPNGHWVDGPVLDLQFRSFVGKHPIPLVYGLTLGELACMINGEGWLKNQMTCDLQVVPIANYTHQTSYTPPVPPSPNLPTDQAIALYPSLVFFEGTTISTGRGTPFPFQALGYPHPSFGDFAFVPISIPNRAPHPKHQDQHCYGLDLRTQVCAHRIELRYLLRCYRLAAAQGVPFFGPTFDIHAGNNVLRQQLEAGLSEEAIRDSWQEALQAYGAKRTKYLLYE